MKNLSVLLLVALTLLSVGCTSRRVVVKREQVAGLNDSQWHAPTQAKTGDTKK